MEGNRYYFNATWATRQPWRGVFVLLVTIAASLIITVNFSLLILI